MKLSWAEKSLDGIAYWEAESSVATFTLTFLRTNNIRGPWQLLIQRKNPFIGNDVRNYHDLENAQEEAALINEAVLTAEKGKND